MQPDTVIFSLLVVAGCLRLAVSVFNWRWYIDGHRGRFLAWVYGPQGARIFFAVVGSLMMAVGVAGLAGVF
ncbi:MAG: immunity 17 family protein [Deinococcota bacterium]